MSKLKHINRNIDWHFETARIIARLKATGAMMAYIDLFCGAGGTSSGVEKALVECYGPVIIKMHPELRELRQAA